MINELLCLNLQPIPQRNGKKTEDLHGMLVAVVLFYKELSRTSRILSADFVSHIRYWHRHTLLTITRISSHVISASISAHNGINSCKAHSCYVSWPVENFALLGYPVTVNTCKLRPTCCLSRVLHTHLLGQPDKVYPKWYGSFIIRAIEY